MEKAIVLIEQNLIKSSLQNQDKIFNLEKFFEFFISKESKLLVKSIVNLFKNNLDINPTSLYIEVSKNSSSFSKEEIKSLFSNEEIDLKNFDFYLESLKRENLKLNIQTSLLEDLLKETSKKSDLNISKLENLNNQLTKGLSLLRNDEELILTGKDLSKIHDDSIKKRQTDSFYYDTGCSYLNEILMEGFAPSKITTIFGASGIGKSSFATYLVNKQINKQIPSIYISLEMDAISTMDRLLAQRTGLSINSFFPSKNGDPIEPHILSLLNNEKKKIENAKYFRLIENPSLTMIELESIIDNIKREMGVDYIVITIDLLTMIHDFNIDSGNKANAYEHAMNYEHAIAKKTGCHFVNVVQALRPSSKIIVNEIADIEKFRPSIQNIKNSAAIEERSRIVMSVFRPYHYAQIFLPEDEETLTMNDIMEVSILKQNMGKIGHVLKYLFIPESNSLFRFEEENVEKNF